MLKILAAYRCQHIEIPTEVIVIHFSNDLVLILLLALNLGLALVLLQSSITLADNSFYRGELASLFLHTHIGGNSVSGRVDRLESAI